MQGSLQGHGDDKHEIVSDTFSVPWRSIYIGNKGYEFGESVSCRLYLAEVEVFELGDKGFDNREELVSLQSLPRAEEESSDKATPEIQWMDRNEGGAPKLRSGS